MHSTDVWINQYKIVERLNRSMIVALINIINGSLFRNSVLRDEASKAMGTSTAIASLLSTFILARSVWTDYGETLSASGNAPQS